MSIRLWCPRDSESGLSKFFQSSVGDVYKAFKPHFARLPSMSYITWDKAKTTSSFCFSPVLLPCILHFLSNLWSSFEPNRLYKQIPGASQRPPKPWSMDNHYLMVFLSTTCFLNVFSLVKQFSIGVHPMIPVIRTTRDKHAFPKSEEQVAPCGGNP